MRGTQKISRRGTISRSRKLPALAPFRPLASNSPWNTTKSAGLTYGSATPGMAAIASSWAVGLSCWDAGNPSIAIWRAADTDPLVATYYHASAWSMAAANGGSYPRSGLNSTQSNAILAGAQTTCPFPQNPYSSQASGLTWNNGGGVPLNQYEELSQTEQFFIRCPTGAVPPPDGDGLTVIIQPDGRAFEMYSAFVLASGVWVSMMHSFTDAVGGQGVGSENGRRASMVPAYAGAITDRDVSNGTIDHALVMNIPATMLTASWVSPALAFDSNDNYSGTVPMGSKFSLPDNVSVASLGLNPGPGTMIGTAIKNYGIIVGDRGGGDGITIATDLNLTASGWAEYTDDVAYDLSQIFGAIRRIV